MRQAFLMLGLATLAWTNSVSAQDADQLFEEGVEQLRRGNYSRAATAFHGSYSLEPRVSAICNLAVTYDQWGGHEGDAISFYERCAREDTTGRYRQHALERADVLRQQHGGSSRRGDPFVGTAQNNSIATGNRVVVPPRSRSRAFLISGLVLGAAAAGTLVPAIIKSRSSAADEEYLRARYNDHQIPSHVDGEVNPDVAILDEAQRNARVGRALYITSGAVAGLALVFVIVDLGAGAVESPRPLPITAGPIEGGGMITGTLSF